MNTHTPGPWRMHKFDDGSICIRAGDGYGAQNITGVLRPENYQDDKEMTANARLIAAAPELLQACKIALPLLQEYRERVIKGEITGRLLSGDCQPTRALEAAIEKAEPKES